MVFPPVPSEIAHGMGNEDQDTVALLEKCTDVDKRETRLPEAKRYSVGSTEVKRW
jgi:hypothetical protein